MVGSRLFLLFLLRLFHVVPLEPVVPVIPVVAAACCADRSGALQVVLMGPRRIRNQ